jgi:hypothetical protein
MNRVANSRSAEALFDNTSSSIAVGSPHSSSFTTEDKFRMDSTKTLTPMRRLYRNLSESYLNLSNSNILKSPLEKETIAMSKLPGASKKNAAENDKMSKFPEIEVAVSTSNQQGKHAKLEHDTLSANTSYTSSSVESPLSSVATSNEAKIRVDGANHHHEIEYKQKSPLGPIFCLFPEGGRADLGKRRAELNQLEREKQELGKRRAELGLLEREKQALVGQVMALKQELAEYTMTLQEQQNAKILSPQREAPIRRLARSLSESFLNVSKRNLLRSPLEEKKKAVSKLPGSKEFATAPSLETDQMSNVSETEQTMALEQQQNATTASPIRRLFHNLSARNLLKSKLKKKKNAASKPPGNIEFAAASTLENDQMSKFPERNVAASTSNRQGDREKLERNNSRRRASHPGLQRQAAFRAPKGELEKIYISYEQIVDPNFRPDDDRTSFTGW